MTIEAALVISVISLAFALYQGVSNLKMNERTDAKNDASELTMVIVKLESIGTGITEIKSEMTNVKNDIKEDRERIIRVEESVKQAHKRQDVSKEGMKTMKKIDWKSKFTSRKFWAALIGFITAIKVAFNVNELTIEQVTAVISACSVLFAYIIGEGLVDSSRLSSESLKKEGE